LDAAFAAAGARARHAFVPEAAATKTAAAASGGNHDVGNRGIEHAPPKAVKAALDVARPSHPTGRKAFTPEWARERGLAGAFEGAPHDGGRRSAPAPRPVQGAWPRPVLVGPDAVGAQPLL
jgi:hypothetical protein